MWDTTSHVCIMVPNTTHSHCKALRCNEGPQVPCANNAVIPAVFPPPEKKCLTIVNYHDNGGMVVSTGVRGLGPNFLSNFECHLDAVSKFLLKKQKVR
eukprot:211480-Ditylum_brightwellii.AAC.2